MLQRYTPLPSTESVKIDERLWDNGTYVSIYKQLETAFPHLELVLMSSNAPLSIEEDLVMFSQAEIIVGAHGAGLTNLMFMPENSFLLEVVGKYDIRGMPVCGYHGNLAAIFGVHHYSYYYDMFTEKIGPEELKEGFVKFYWDVKQSHCSDTICTL